MHDSVYVLSALFISICAIWLFVLFIFPTISHHAFLQSKKKEMLKLQNRVLPTFPQIFFFPNRMEQFISEVFWPSNSIYPNHLYSFFLILIYLFYFTILHWFCHTLNWICHECTCVLHPEPPSHLPLHPIPLGHPGAPAPNTLFSSVQFSHSVMSNSLWPHESQHGSCIAEALCHASNLDWRFTSHMIFYMFQCHFPILSPLPFPQSPKDCSIHLCLFCCLAYRVIVTFFLNSIYMH